MGGIPLPALFAASSGLSAIGSLVQGSEQGEALDFKSSLLAQNAQTAREEGRAEFLRFRRKARKAQGATKAAYAGAGVALDQGSPLDVLAEQDATLEEEARLILYKAASRSRDFMVQSIIAGEEADSARAAGSFGAVSSLLGGAIGAGKSKGLSFSVGDIFGG